MKSVGRCGLWALLLVYFWKFKFFFFNQEEFFLKKCFNTLCDTVTYQIGMKRFFFSLERGG